MKRDAKAGWCSACRFGSHAAECLAPHCICPATEHARNAVTEPPGPRRAPARPRRPARPVQKVCLVEGCDRPHDSYGLCKAHRDRLVYAGDLRPDVPIATPLVHEVEGCRVCGAGTYVRRPWCWVQTYPATEAVA